MAAPKTKTKEQRMQRVAKVAELYLKCNTMAEIGRILGISYDTVYKDICIARQEWRTQAASSIEQLKQVELGRIDHLEVEAWKAWDRSIGIVKTTTKDTGLSAQGPVDKTSEKTERKAGDPRFLDQVNKCIEHRRKILGLDAPAQAAVSVYDSVGSMLADRLNRAKQEGTETVQ